jgi:hypothetical protein
MDLEGEWEEDCTKMDVEIFSTNLPTHYEVTRTGPSV